MICARVNRSRGIIEMLMDRRQVIRYRIEELESMHLCLRLRRICRGFRS